jgi:hypothetical protein
LDLLSLEVQIFRGYWMASWFKSEIYDNLYRRVYKQMYSKLKPLYGAIRDITGCPAGPPGRQAAGQSRYVWKRNLW